MEPIEVLALVLGVALALAIALIFYLSCRTESLEFDLATTKNRADRNLDRCLDEVDKRKSVEQQLRAIRKAAARLAQHHIPQEPPQ